MINYNMQYYSEERNLRDAFERVTGEKEEENY